MFFISVQLEMSKVSWPDWSQLKSSTYVVLVFTVIITIFLFVVDYVLSKTVMSII